MSVKTSLIAILAGSLAVSAIAEPQQPTQPSAAEMQAQALPIVKRFGVTLKPQLQAAVKSGGFAHAINVCADIAPAIAAQISQDTGWTVKRVSLKARNPNAVPDAYERGVLENFERRKAEGEAVAALNDGQWQDGRYRFMKAQGVEGLCLNCHGSNLAPPVVKALSERYPQDRATGYAVGDIRGAISLIAPE